MVSPYSSTAPPTISSPFWRTRTTPRSSSRTSVFSSTRVPLALAKLPSSSASTWRRSTATRTCGVGTARSRPSTRRSSTRTRSRREVLDTTQGNG
ncbi:hypothetical protein C8034_v012315 [Colletotrichum sidae]|uniref:Uncharacterized protein n=1 Tax=Colletotrichum sidae TaxID=1347389 RepID=A0A4R8T037_9PEZI|nr:hypothetical protein C8034_v012315 [Colletotrichum sidae]